MMMMTMMFRSVLPFNGEQKLLMDKNENENPPQN